MTELIVSKPTQTSIDVILYQGSNKPFEDDAANIRLLCLTTRPDILRSMSYSLDTSLIS